MKPIGLYIHVPFCERKCPYCNFFSTTKITNEIIDRYTDIICNTLVKYKEKIKLSFDTVYFGGGTPSLLGDKNLIKIIKTIKNNFKLFGSEITLEINPTTLPIVNLKQLREEGFNRLSVGVQSTIDRELKILGRQYSQKDIKNTIKLAKIAGFTNISLDLMLAIPEQSIKSLKQSINFFISQDIQHISAYLLKVEKETLFYKNKNKLNLKNENEESEMYLFLASELTNNGFKHYEISNFARNGYKSKHNLKYWNSKDYLGIGPSAHSFLAGRRFYYQRSLQKFLSGNSEVIYDGKGGTIEEYIMLRLRLSDGIKNNLFKQRFGINIPQIYFEKAKNFQKYGLTVVDKSSIKLTNKGFLLSNELISRILL